ncbi:MAG: DUF86 domain-containing protein [Deltaproteobacteria bacterium]|nr:DUF86 domain-containing protein [Deltaproteobacteria bacterium]
MKSIERKFKSAEERVQKLKLLSQRAGSYEDYQMSSDLKDLAERNLQVAIEACLDIGKIIISAEGLEEPKDNKGIFVVLAQAGIINSKSLTFLLPMAGARNILVHGYDKIDDSLIYGVLKRHTDDFVVFLKQIRDNYLSKT